MNEVSEAKRVALVRRTAIMEFQAILENDPNAVGPESCPVFHHFAPGQYGREIHMPAGMRVVGKIHKHAHVNVISKGKVRVYTEQEGLLELEAPLTFVSSPGTKRAVYVVEDTVWTTFHCTTKTNLEEIEREVIAADFMEV